jgi:hypothetical protein
MKFLFRTILLTLSAFVISLTAYCQGSLGISSLTISPSGTVTNASTITAQGSFVNTGTLTLAGTVTVNLAINTSTTSTPVYVIRNSATYTVSSFTTATTHTFAITDVASGANQYRIDGNGTTVVVWPVMSNAAASDSGKVTVYVQVPNSLEDLAAFEQEILKIENPLYHNLTLKYDELLYRTVELLNAQGQVVQVIQNKTLDISLLSPGMYYLNYHHQRSGRIVSKKLLIE